MSVILCLPTLLEQDVLEILTRQHMDRLVARRAADLAEILGAASAGVGSMVITHSDLEYLDLTAIKSLQHMGLDVAMVVGEHSVDNVRSWGVRILAPNPNEVVATIATTAQERTYTTADEIGSGRIVAVWGPSGSHGRTFIARELAMILEALAIDADTFAPSLAQLADVEETSALLAWGRHIDQGKPTSGILAELVQSDGDGTAILAGLNSPRRWKELSANVLEKVWEDVRRQASLSVIDVAGGLSDEIPGLRADRWAATRTVLEAADLILAVTSANPIGLRRLLEHADLYGTDRTIAVVNGVRASAVGRQAGAQIDSVLRREVFPVFTIRDDRPRVDVAALNGRTLIKAVPSSPAAKDLATLATAVREALG